MEKENEAKKREDHSFLFKVCVYNVYMKVKSKQQTLNFKKNTVFQG